MTKEQAIETFRNLVQQYGLKWTKDVPPEAWEKLHQCNEHLTESERRETLGFPR